MRNPRRLTCVLRSLAVTACALAAACASGAGGYSGRIATPADSTNAHRGRPMVQGLAPRDLRVQMLGTDAAVVSFHLGEQTPGRRSIVFGRSAVGWQVAHWHASPTPQEMRR